MASLLYSLSLCQYIYVTLLLRDYLLLYIYLTLKNVYVPRLSSFRSIVRTSRASRPMHFWSLFQVTFYGKWIRVTDNREFNEKMPHCRTFNCINGIDSFLSILCGLRSLTFTEGHEQKIMLHWKRLVFGLCKGFLSYWFPLTALTILLWS